MHLYNDILIVISGGAICYECDSKANQCSPGSLTGAIERECSRNNDYCAIYKKEPPGNTSYHQFTRYCASECDEADTITSYTTGGPYQQTKNCIVCCKGDFCNNYLYDPCNPPSTALDMKCGMFPPSTALDMKCGMFPITILSVIAVIM